MKCSSRSPKEGWGTDEHFKSAEMVLGHEGVVIVQKVGAEVDTFKVGWGFLHHSCMHCDQCSSGNDMPCIQRAISGLADLNGGAFTSHAVWKAGYLSSHIPESISSVAAAPLMCAGSTVFDWLHTYVQLADRVGVVGTDGLELLAIQSASKMRNYRLLRHRE
ncbi:chaperonin 10-like protein [Boletus reticuloceps]|uniref:Chaperonin 10-like protein n=1 Tax=Boletus reticuloceps TaxID=495285 RepID=A0A8I2YMD0_9AGAM|nr:chaperonin 10-like protein [Boletus reticuloceps]